MHQISWRQIYNLLNLYRTYNKQLLSLIPKKSSGVRGSIWITSAMEHIIQTVIDEFYLTKQQTKISLVVEEIIRSCKQSGITSPSNSAIRRRIENISERIVQEKRRGCHASKQYSSLKGAFPEQKPPHNVWQIDHTSVDLIIVYEFYRKPIGRPYLSLAINVYSRCITGFCLTLD